MKDKHKYISVLDPEFEKDFLRRIKNDKTALTKIGKLSEDNYYFYKYGIFESCRKIRSVKLDPIFINNDFLDYLMQYDYCEEILGNLIAISSKNKEFAKLSNSEKSVIIISSIASTYHDKQMQLTSKKYVVGLPKVLTKSNNI